MLNGKKTSIVIPCLNEAEALPKLLGNIPEYASEVIVVDNGSTDNSVEVAQRYPIRLVREKERGYGSALLKGIREASGDIIVLLDADGTYPFESLPEALTLLETDRFDFISGCRFPLANKAFMPLVNRLANGVISWLIRVLFKISLKDSQSGLMMFSRRLLGKIEIKNRGMEFSQEIKIKAWLVDPARCTEVPIVYNVRIGTSKYRKIPDSLRTLSQLIDLYIRTKWMANGGKIK